jgi:hypothetical protein
MKFAEIVTTVSETLNFLAELAGSAQGNSDGICISKLHYS